jgi:hypothetical protein
MSISSQGEDQMDDHYPNYLFLGYGCWAKREDVPASLLAPYDRTVGTARANPSKIDSLTGRAVAALWLDAADAIRKTVNYKASGVEFGRGKRKDGKGSADEERWGI